jgi:hypothetical protein
MKYCGSIDACEEGRSPGPAIHELELLINLKTAKALGLSMKRMTQSRSVWRSIPPTFAASFHEAPSSTAAIANSRRACPASFACFANRRTSPAV